MEWRWGGSRVADDAIHINHDLFFTQGCYLRAGRIALLFDVQKHNDNSPNAHSFYIKAIGETRVACGDKVLSSDEAILIFPQGMIYSRPKIAAVESLKHVRSHNKPDSPVAQGAAQYDLKTGNVSWIAWGETAFLDKKFLLYRDKLILAEPNPQPMQAPKRAK